MSEVMIVLGLGAGDARPTRGSVGHPRESRDQNIAETRSVDTILIFDIGDV